MQRISENCQIFFEEERFDELDFFGIHRVFRRQRILTITFFCNYSSVDVTNCTTILFIYFLIGCAALSFYGINLTNDFFYSILLFKELFLFRFLIFQFKNTPISLYLCIDKIKGQSGKNATLTPTKTLPKNWISFLLIFKLLYPLINQIVKIKIIYKK